MPLSNPFQTQRRRNILAPSFGQEESSTPKLSFDFNDRQSTGSVVTRKPRTYEDDIADLENNPSPGLQAYKDYLTRMPKPEDNRPGAMTRIAAGLSGFSAGLRDPGEGVKVAQELNSSKYRGAIRDYANEGIGLKEQASLENTERDDKLKALQNARAMGLKYDEFDLKRRETEAQMTNQATTANAAMKRAEAYAAAQAKPGYDAQPQQDGSLLYINKSNPADRITVPAKTIQAGQLGVARTNAATAQGQLGVARTNASTNQVNAGINAVRAETGSRAADAAAKRGVKAPTPQAQAQAEANALNMMRTDPLFKKYVIVGKDGYGSVADDDGTLDYQDFLDALDAKIAEIHAGTVRRGSR